METLLDLSPNSADFLKKIILKANLKIIGLEIMRILKNHNIYL